MEIKQLADNVFRHPVKGENSISLEFECIENPKDLFETFLELFTEGMKILFGNNGQVDLTSLNKEQFSLIQKYFKSMRITLYYHVFHIKQIENLENSRSNNIKVKYDIINPISDEIIKENFPEMPKPEYLKKYKNETSSNIKDYKFQLKVGDLLYVIYFEL